MNAILKVGRLQIHEKITFVKSKLKEWNKVSFENLKEEKHSFGQSVLVSKRNQTSY